MAAPDYDRTPIITRLEKGPERDAVYDELLEYHEKEMEVRYMLRVCVCGSAYACVCVFACYVCDVLVGSLVCACACVCVCVCV